MKVLQPVRTTLAVALAVTAIIAAFPAAAGAWTLTGQTMLADPVGSPGDRFGTAVAVSGDTAVVGDKEWPFGSGRGQVHVYARTGSVWGHQATLVANSGPGDWYGQSVAINGDTVVVGAPWEDVGANGDQGVAYVYTRSGAVWSLEATFTGADSGAGGLFGYSVAIATDTVAVGAPGGAAYVFTRAGGVWTQRKKLTASDGDNLAWFGSGAALSGDTLVIGAFRRTVGANANQGEAYVFTGSGSVWSQQATLTASDGAAEDFFGWSVGVSGDTAIVGAYQHDPSGSENQGAAYVYARTGDAWAPVIQLTGGMQYAGFGRSVAISGDKIAVGTPWWGGYGTPSVAPGAVYLFQRYGDAWGSLAATAPAGVGDRLGMAVALDGETLVAGAPYDDVGSPSANIEQGSAYTFALAPDVTACALTSPSRTTNYAQNVAITGAITARGLALEGAPVQLQRLSGATWFDTGLMAPSSATGTFTFSVAPTVKTSYRARFAGAPGFSGSDSGAITLTPRAWLTNVYSASTARRGIGFIAYGYLRPRHPAYTYPVKIYRYRWVDGGWRSYGAVSARAVDHSSYTKWVASLSLPYRGKWRLRAYAPSDAWHAATWSSGYRYVTVY